MLLRQLKTNPRKIVSIAASTKGASPNAGHTKVALLFEEAQLSTPVLNSLSKL
jgi:hypothetical protein